MVWLRRIFGAVALAILASAAQAAPALDAYGRLPGIEAAALSPTGFRYAIVGAVGAERRLLVVDEKNKPIVNAPIGPRKVREIAWAGEDRVLVYSTEAFGLTPRLLTKYEIGELLVVNLKTKKSFSVLSQGRSGNGVRGLYAIRQEGDHWYAYVGGIRFGRSVTTGKAQYRDMNTDLFKVDLDSNHAQALEENVAGTVMRSWAIGEQGGVAAYYEYDRRTGRYEVAAPGSKPVAQGTDKLGDAGLAGLGRTPGTVLYRERGADNEDAWTEADLKTGDKLLLFKGIRIAEQYRDNRTGLLLGYRRDSDKPNLRFYNQDQQLLLLAAQLAFPHRNVWLKSWNDAVTRVIVETDGPDDSGSWWIVDNITGRADEIGRSYPLVKPDDVAPVDMVTYTAADGLEIAGVLTLPKGLPAKGLPLVVLPHDEQTRDYPRFNWWAQAYASRGYAVLQPNFRGSEGYGADFRAAGDGEWGGKIQRDIADGIAALAAKGIVDPKRVCIAGSGYGGYAALAGVTLQSGLYRCAVAVAAMSDLPKMEFSLGLRGGLSGPGVRSFRDDFGQGVLEDRSPIRHAARADAPILLIHGDKDTVVQPAQSRAMAKALQEAGKPVEYLELKGEDHWLSQDETRLAMLKAAVAFVEKYNPPN